MRFDFDREKSREVKRRHGVSLKDAQEIFDQVYLIDQKNAIQNSSVQSDGAAVACVLSSSRSGVTPMANTTTWSQPGKRPNRKSKAMPKTSRTTPTADEIAENASRGEDVSAYFTNKFTTVRPVRRVNVDLTQGMLRELDERAARLNISRQAVIKTLLERALNNERLTRPASKKKAG